MGNTSIGRYARILMDDWFKRSFGTESRKRLLQLFLEELIPERKIKSLTYTNTEHINPFPGKKDVRIDVECTDQDGVRFIVEVQVADQQYFYERALFNSTFGIQQQKGKGEEDYDFPAVYFVGLMDFSRHEGDERVDYRYQLRESRNGELMTDRLQFIFLELPNSLSRALRPGSTLLENFCYALHQMEHLTEQPAELRQEIFRLLFDSAEIATFSPEEKAKYEQDMTTERDIHNQIAYARMKGREEGRIEGRQEVLQKMIALMRGQGVNEEIIENLARGLKSEE